MYGITEFCRSQRKKLANAREKPYSGRTTVMMELFKRIYGGRMGRKALVRPLCIITVGVIVGAGCLYYGLMEYLSSWSREDIALAKQEAILLGDADMRAVLERCAELLNIGCVWGALLTLVVAYAVWVLLTSPYWVRRLRDAGVKPDWFCMAVLPVLPMVYVAYTMESPLQLEYDVAMQRAMTATGVVFIACSVAVLLLVFMAFYYPTKERG